MTIAGKKFGVWTVLSTDASGKRAVCRCMCGAVQVVSVEALSSGNSTSCGCAALSPEHVSALRAEAAHHRRQCDRDWRPQR